MKRNISRHLAFAYLIAASATAFASAHSNFKDNIPIPATSWTGFYVGAEAGKSWNTTDSTYQNRNYFNTLGSTLLGNQFNFASNGAIGGIDAGYQYQTGALVIGVEGSVLDVDLNSTKTSPFFPGSDVYHSQLKWLTTAKGRAGYAFNHWLASISGGWAGGQNSLNLEDTFGNINANSTNWANGWIAGAGIDYMVTQHLFIGASYDYIRLTLNNQTVSCRLCGTGPGGGTPSVNNLIKTQAVMARVNYRL